MAEVAMGGSIRQWTAFGLAMVVASCTSAQAGAGVGDSAAPASALITRAEIDRAQWPDAYELVRNLRPRWIRARGPDKLLGETGQVQVYVDGTRLGGVELLRGMPTTAIDHLRWVDPVDAAGRWGSGHGHGVIALSYRPRGG
jgi:hypothetical protein